MGIAQSALVGAGPHVATDPRSRQFTPNIAGDRDIEWSWVAANLPDGSGEALDFGPGGSWMGLLAARRGWRVTAVDLNPAEHFYRHPRLGFTIGDLLTLSLPADFFELIINCSTVEHVGLAGRYGVTEDSSDGDLAAMQRLRWMMRANGRMLLTVPVGRDRVFRPWHRVYGRTRLPELLRGYKVISKEFWTKDADNRWNVAPEAVAIDEEPLVYCYALGLFVLGVECEGVMPH
jgi:hypothetical protein